MGEEPEVLSPIVLAFLFLSFDVRDRSSLGHQEAAVGVSSMYPRTSYQDHVSFSFCSFFFPHQLNLLILIVGGGGGGGGVGFGGRRH